MKRTPRMLIAFVLAVALLLPPFSTFFDVFFITSGFSEQDILWPVQNSYLIYTLYYYYNNGKPERHKGWNYKRSGIDIAADYNDKIIAVTNGTVIAQYGFGMAKTTVNGGTCRYVRIKSSEGDYISGYYHMSEVLVKAGDSVSAGQVIGYVGQTGNATGPHLHFEWSGNDPWQVVYRYKYWDKITYNSSVILANKMMANSNEDAKEADAFFRFYGITTSHPYADKRPDDWHGFQLYTEPPAALSVSVDKKIALINSDITIRFWSERASSYWIGIYKDDVLFTQSRVYDNSYTVEYPWVGEYHVVVVAQNNCGEASGYESFYVGKEGDYEPENFTVSCNKTTAIKNESVVLSFSADNATTYWIGIYHNDEWIMRENYTTNSFTVNYSEPGEYRVAVVAMNSCSSTDAKYVSFTVLDMESSPTKPTVTVEKSVNLINEPITISYNSFGAEDYWIGIYKDGVLFNDYATTEKQITVDYPWVGKYNVVIVARNIYGSTSGYASFYVGKEGDYIPTNFTVKGNKALAFKNEAVTVTYHADNATAYWIGVYHNGDWIMRENYVSITCTVKYSDLGEYRIAVVAMNPCSSTDAQYFRFTVVEQKTFTVQYDANGGFSAPEPQSKEYNQAINLSLQIPEKEGYSFSKWNIKPDGTSADYSAGSVYSDNANLLLYAQWTPNTYDVQFNGNGATSGSMSTQVFVYDTAQALTSNTFKRTYTVSYSYDDATGGNNVASTTAAATFNGWATSANGAKIYNDKQSVRNLATGGTVNLYANWTLITVTLPTPTKTGYTFKGWNTRYDGTGTTYAAGAAYKLTANSTLYAVWQKTQTPDNPPTATPTVAIRNYAANKTVDYRTSITFTAEVENPVNGAAVHWFVDNKDVGTGETYTVKEAKESYIVQVKYLQSGNVLAESQTEKVTVQSGFFARLKAFFSALFGRLPKVVQEAYDVEFYLNLLP